MVGSARLTAFVLSVHLVLEERWGAPRTDRLSCSV